MIISPDLIAAFGLLSPTSSALLAVGTTAYGAVSSAKSEKGIIAALKKTEESIIRKIDTKEKHRDPKARFHSCFLFELSTNCSEQEFDRFLLISKERYFLVPIHDALSKLSEGDGSATYSIFLQYLKAEQETRFQQIIRDKANKIIFQSLWQAVRCAAKGSQAGHVSAKFVGRWLKRIEDKNREDHEQIIQNQREMKEMLKEAKKAKAKPKLSLKQEEAVLRKYLESVVAGTDRIDIKGIFSRTGASRRAMYFPIEKNYTPLKTSSGRQLKLEFDSESIKRNEELLMRQSAERTPLTALLSKHRRLLIVGQPGGGKTTFMKLVACVLAKDCLAKKGTLRKKHLGLSVKQPAPIPIFIRLAALASIFDGKTKQKSIKGNFHQFIMEYIKEDCGEAEAKILERKLNENKCALLLDGLDEVADPKARKQIIDCVNSALHRWGDNLVLITSRPFGFNDVADLNRTQTAFIDDFGKEEINEFLHRWVDSLYPEKEQATIRDEYMTEISVQVLSVPVIRRMAKNPVMLTCLCVVHWNERKLPHGKADLMAAVLRWLLNAREDLRKETGFHNTFAEEAFKALALEMTAHKKGKRTIVDLEWAADSLKKPFADEYGIKGRPQQKKGVEFLENEMIISGIVEQFGVGRLRFWHLTMQEHFAARALAEKSDEDRWKVIEKHLWNQQWNEVIDHLAGCLAWAGRGPLNRLVENILNTADLRDLPSVARTVGVLGRVLRILEVYDNYQPPARLNWENYREKVMRIFSHEGATKVPVEDRIAAAEALGQGGDPRIRPLEPEMLPIPGNENVLLGKFPVTVQEFSCFIEEDGYMTPEYWKEYWNIVKKRAWRQPQNWDDQLHHPNRPVAGVSWFEAKAYCSWLSKRTGRNYRLQKDVEWTKAASHPSGGDYPWGKKKPNKELLNFYRNVGRPTPVGVYPTGAGAGGHHDLSGNVWEWCWDLYEEEKTFRVVRGGSWGNLPNGVRASFRFRYEPVNRYGSVGFRLSRD